MAHGIAGKVLRSVRQPTFGVIGSAETGSQCSLAHRRLGAIGRTVSASVLVEKLVKSKQTMPTRDGIAVVATPCDAPPDLMSAGARSGPESATSDSQAGWSSVSISKWQEPTAADRRSQKIRSWRRRALLKRGARLHTAQGAKAERNSLAMLDEAGMVVCWYGCADGHDQAAVDVVDRHMSLFYVPEEVARRRPHRDLRAAVIEGRITREAWRRRPDGSAFWGTIVIEPVVLRDGRVQGFSFVTSCS